MDDNDNGSPSLDQGSKSSSHLNTDRSGDEADSICGAYSTNYKMQWPLNHTLVQRPTNNDNELADMSSSVHGLIPEPGDNVKMIPSSPLLSSSSSLDGNGGYSCDHDATGVEPDTGGVMFENDPTSMYTSTFTNHGLSDYQIAHEMEHFEDAPGDYRDGGVSLNQDLLSEHAELENLHSSFPEIVTGILYSSDHTNDQISSENHQDQVLLNTETSMAGNSAIAFNDTSSDISDESDAEPITDSQSSSPEVGTIMNSDSSMYDEPSMWEADSEAILSYEDYPATEMLEDLELNESLPEDENNEGEPSLYTFTMLPVPHFVEMDTDNNDFADFVGIVINNNFPISPSFPAETQWFSESETNRSFSEFCKSLYREYCRHSNSKTKIGPRALDVASLDRPSEVTAEDMEKGETDMQAIPWDVLDIDRAVARQARNERYHNYTNLIGRNHPMKVGTIHR